MDGKTGPEKPEISPDVAWKAESECYGAILGPDFFMDAGFGLRPAS